nr:phage head-tail adapter protein [Laribacter sp.]
VAERHEEKLLMLGPVLERLHNEILDPLIEMTFSRMVEAGIVPPPPEELQGVDLNVEFVSMLAQAQRAIATNSVDRFVGNLGAVAGIKPEVLDKFDADRWADAYADMLGIDPELIVPGDQVALIRQQRAKAQQAQQQAAMLQMGADAAQKLGSIDTSQSSALTDVTRAFSGYT